MICHGTGLIRVRAYATTPQLFLLPLAGCVPTPSYYPNYCITFMQSECFRTCTESGGGLNCNFSRSVAVDPVSQLLSLSRICTGQLLALKMSATDTQHSRYANTNANARLRSASGWGSDGAREQYTPVGQRIGSVLVLSGPKVRSFIVLHLVEDG